MKPFIMVARPHKDVLEGKTSLSVYAADLWEVYKKEASEEYQNSEIFFKRTYLTQGLKNLIEISEKRLKGLGGDPVIQLQTPFGGGKTHALIALYHKAMEWGAKVFVFSGDKVKGDLILWQELEKQLTGEVREFTGEVVPGGEKLKNFLKLHEPLLILMDEIHAYLTKASAVKIGNSDLATQTLVFLQDLTVAVKGLERTLFMATLPSSNPYGNNEKAEELLRGLKSILGRVEKVYTPVQDEEIAHVIRKRLFTSIDEVSAKEIIDNFLEYAEREKILPEGIERTSYRFQFLNSYPFQPEVIEVLYKRWGSYPDFQRTRGVLRLLSILVHALKDSQKPFIRLSDFDLKNEEIRRELIKHAGQEYDSILAQDITDANSGAKKVDKALGEAYNPYKLGTKVATTIFTYSFPEFSSERGATVNEIKLATSEPAFSSSVIVEVIDKLKETLFYLSDHGLYFTNTPNLNKILLDKMENIREEEILEVEKEGIKKSLGRAFKCYLWVEEPKDVPDTPEYKLVILQNEKVAKNILEFYGKQPRIYKNTLFFLCPFSEAEKIPLHQSIKKLLALEKIERDPGINLKDEQRKEIKKRIEKIKKGLKTYLREAYRKVLLPEKDGLKEIDLGKPTYGAERKLDEEIRERLKAENEFLTEIHPRVIKEFYLKDKDWVETKKIYDATLTTPGERRFADAEVLKRGVKEGVKQGLFGLGKLLVDVPELKAFKAECEPTLDEKEMIISAELCRKILAERKNVEKSKVPDPTYEPFKPKDKKEFEKSFEKPSEEKDYCKGFRLELSIPEGKFFEIVRLCNFLKTCFQKIEIEVSLYAKEGKISKFDYEDKVKEALKQAGITIEDEEIF